MKPPRSVEISPATTVIPPKIGTAICGDCPRKTQIIRHPESEATQRESHCGLREAIKHKRPIPEQGHVVVFCRTSALRHKARSGPGILLKKAGDPEHDAGDCHKIESPTPAELMVDYPTQNKTECAAHRDRRTKNSHDAAPHLSAEQICQDRRGRGPVSSLADSNKNTRCEQGCECEREPPCRRREAPKNHTGAHDNPARETIRQKTQDGRRQHVSDEERRRQRAGYRHGVRIPLGEKRLADIWFDRRQDEAVDVIEKINAKQEAESDARSRFGLGIVLGHSIDDCTEQPAPCKP